MNRPCVVIPVYKTSISDDELLSLNLCKKILGHYTVILAAPEGMSVEAYLTFWPELKIERFKASYFKNTKAYSKMLLSAGFYGRFLEYDYMLIYQGDALVFKDELQYWCDQNYTYIGSPWIDAHWIQLYKDYHLGFIEKRINRVGNGGLSLRRVKTFYKACKWLWPIASLFWKEEDVFWSNVAYFLYPGFRIPDFNTALKFSFELQPRKAFDLNNQQIPFGCHAWEKYDRVFWEDILKKNEVLTFK
ncbi:DUF5672 family protein [Solitalea longa]|uniref:DUF5672 family protein n=1 Tax=Solitalea longa TaxID=2079460 RepID=UPI0010571E9B|nr:DUF5672 family protein [Solitalea longa]